MDLIRIATRNSPLALWQANYVREALLKAHPRLKVEIVGMTTKGDQLLDRSLAQAGGKGLFLKELEVSLLNEQTDIAVHSMKDVPVELPRGLEIAAVCERADPRDAMVSNVYQNLYALPDHSIVGTSSLRRTSQLKNAFPNLEFVELRGNVNTRLRKLDIGEYDAIILAAAGLIRLGFEDRIKQYIKPELCLPAVGQGIVGIECRSDDEATKAFIEPLHSLQTEVFLAAERAMNKALDGGCQVPIGGFAEMAGSKIQMRGLVGEVDGSRLLVSHKSTTEVSLKGATELGEKIAQDLLEQGAQGVLKSVYNDSAQREGLTKAPVILTRQESFLGNSQSILEYLGHPSFHLPTLEIQPNKNADVQYKLENLQQYTDLIFVSRNSVEAGMQIINEYGGLPDNIRVMSVGPETAKQLYKMGIEALFPQTGVGAEALLRVSQIRDMSGRKVLIMRGAGGLNWPSQELRKRGAEVDHANCYLQLLPSSSAQKLAKILGENHELGAIFVHSEQSILNLISMAGLGVGKLRKTKLVAGSERIARGKLW